MTRPAKMGVRRFVRHMERKIPDLLMAAEKERAEVCWVLGRKRLEDGAVVELYLVAKPLNRFPRPTSEQSSKDGDD